MFKKQPKVKQFSVLRASDRRQLADSIILRYFANTVTTLSGKAEFVTPFTTKLDYNNGESPFQTSLIPSSASQSSPPTDHNNSRGFLNNSIPHPTPLKGNNETLDCGFEHTLAENGFFPRGTTDEADAHTLTVELRNLILPNRIFSARFEVALGPDLTTSNGTMYACADDLVQYSAHKATFFHLLRTSPSAVLHGSSITQNYINSSSNLVNYSPSSHSANANTEVKSVPALSVTNCMSRVAWLTYENNLIPSIYTVWTHPGILPLLHTLQDVICRLQRGAKLATRGLLRIKEMGYKFPLGSHKGALVAVASIENPSVPLVVGQCLIDIHALNDDCEDLDNQNGSVSSSDEVLAFRCIYKHRGYAVKPIHWYGDYIWRWSNSIACKSGYEPPNTIPEWLPSQASGYPELRPATDSVSVIFESKSGCDKVDELPQEGHLDSVTHLLSNMEVGNTEIYEHNCSLVSPAERRVSVCDSNSDEHAIEWTTELVDRAYYHSFLRGIISYINRYKKDPNHGLKFPMSQSQVQSLLIMEYLPDIMEDQARLNWSCTSWKSLRKFLKYTESLGLVKLKRSIPQSKEVIVVNINFENEVINVFQPCRKLFRQHGQPPACKSLQGVSNNGILDTCLTDARKVLGVDNLMISILFPQILSENMSTERFSPEDMREGLVSYILKHRLTVKPLNISTCTGNIEDSTYIRIDDSLSLILELRRLYTCDKIERFEQDVNKPRGVGATKILQFKDLFRQVLIRCRYVLNEAEVSLTDGKRDLSERLGQKATQPENISSAINLKSVITITLCKSSRKKPHQSYTRISGFPAFGVDVECLARELRKSCGCPTKVIANNSKLAQNSKGGSGDGATDGQNYEVELRGVKHANTVKSVLCSRGIPDKSIKVLDALNK